ncbi:hypothetical protein [Deinococcus sp. RM]|uniref:hypothetical protein n=1 Tax=Deinococcus sp. RM TaxID=2316359 RepID=UPI0011C23985|nr:hypothetical protein [Deinococcus sp. RM]
MTNWCQNRLVVTGADDALGAWRAAQRGVAPTYDRGPVAAQSLSFAAQVPVPPEVVARGYHAGGLGDLQRVVSLQSGGVDPLPGVPLDGAAWQTMHWGSSRDAADVEVVAEPGVLTVTFSSAWSAPVPWLETVGALWPDLTFELWGIEPGNELFVHARVEGGRVVLMDERAPTPEELLAWGYDVDEM